MIDNTKTVSLKELREQFPKYIDAIAKGQSFIVVKRSKPIFRLNLSTTSVASKRLLTLRK